MQWLLLVFFAVLASALALVLGQNLLSDNSALTSIFGFFKDQNVAITLTLGILVAALFSALIYAWESWQRRRHISTLTQALKKDSPNAETFAAHVDQMGQHIETAHAPLQHAWQEFEKTLIRPDPTRVGDGRVVRNTVRPSAYFNVQATVEAGFNLPFWQALPNYFVGFGLLCTFMGLVSGLHFAAEGVASADVNEARSALQDLLRAATFKFLTSIAGVLASLGLSVFIRSQTQALQATLDRFCSALEQRLVFVTPVSIAQEQLREQQKLTVTMQSFSTTLATEIADALNKRMTNPDGKNILVDAVEKLGETFKGNAGEIGSSVSDAVLTGLTAPLQTLTDAMAQLTTASSGAVDRVNEFANTYSVKITQASERFEQGIKAASDEIRAAAEAAAGAVRKGAEDAGEHFGKSGSSAGAAIDDAGRRMLEALTPLVNNIASLQDTLTQVQRSFDAYDQRVQAIKNGMDDSTRALGDVTRSFQSSATALEATARPVREAASALTATVTESNAVSQALQATLQGARGLSESITATQQSLRSAWDQYSARFETTDEKLAATFVTLQDGIHQTEEQVKVFVQGLDQHFATAINSLGGAVQELAETAEELSNAKRR